MASSSSRPDFRNSTAITMKSKSRSLNKFIRNYLSYNDYNEVITESVPQRIKDLIKLVTYWHKEIVRPQHCECNIEQVTLKAWKRFNSPNTINMAIAFKAVLEELGGNSGSSSAAHRPSLSYAVTDTLTKPLFVDVHVTKNWCAKPTAGKNTPKKRRKKTKSSGEKKGLKKLYREMQHKDEKTKRYYSAALAELQIEFVKRIPGRVKDLIRLVKYWCKEFVVPVGRGRGVYPNSYLLELVTINAWEENGSPEAFDMAVGFRAVMEKLRRHETLDIVWYDNYEASLVNERSAPRVIDPANPSNNVYNIVTKWPRVVSVVNETLKKPFVKGVKVTYGWK